LPQVSNLNLISYLLIHGTGDDNVHFQNTAQLVHELTESEVQYRLMVCIMCNEYMDIIIMTIVFSSILIKIIHYLVVTQGNTYIS
jgi:hypothetical protein